MRRVTLTILATIVMILPRGCATGVPRDGVLTENLQERAVSSLSEQFETVLYSKPQFVSRWDTNNPLPKDPASNLRYPFAYLWLALDSLPSPAASEFLANIDAVLMGAKDFRAPSGLGEVRSQRCYVASLKSGSSFDLQNYTHTPAMISPSGRRIWQWSATLGEFGEGTPPKYEFRKQPSTLYATEIEQSYLLLSNDVKELEALAKRLTSPKADSQGSAHFPDWDEMLQPEMSGYRRYYPNNPNDPMAAGTQDLPPGAESLAFFLDVGKKTVILRLYSNDPISESGVAKLSSRYHLPVLTRSGSSIWESTISLSEGRASFDQTFSLAVMFGFGVFT